MAQAVVKPAGKVTPPAVPLVVVPYPDTKTNRGPAPGAIRKPEEAAGLMSQGSELIAKGHLPEAIRVFKQALALTPEDEVLHYNIGIAYKGMGDVTNAELHYREALRLLPDYPEVHNNLGNLLLQTKRWDEAEEQLTAAVQLMPEDASVQNNLGILRQRQHRTNDALACFQKAVACDTNYWQGHFNLGQALLMTGDRERGISELRETLRINPAFEVAERALSRAIGEATAQKKGP